MHTLKHGGLERTYLLYLPGQLPLHKKAPLVMALHGGGGSGKDFARYTRQGFEKLADQDGFILAYPDGIQGQWNDTRTHPHSFAHTHALDDLGFLAALIDALIAAYPVDPLRVYIAGVSNGGMMTHYLAGVYPEKIAAIATVIAAMPENLEHDLHPQAAVSILMINATDDPLVPWEGGDVRLGKRVHGRVLSTADTLAFWRTVNHCQAEPVITRLPDRDPKDGTQVEAAFYPGGLGGAEVVLYTIHGGGHAWPGNHAFRPLARGLLESVVGKKCRDIDACKVIWEFFKKHPKQ